VTATYHINGDDRLVSLRLQGAVDTAELVALGEKLLSDPDFQPAWPQLVDLRQFDLKLTRGINPVLAEYLNTEYLPRLSGNIAVMVNESISAEDCAEAYKLACPMDNTEVFDDYAHAIRWLLHHGMKQAPGSLQHPDTGADRTDEGPEQIRA